MAGQTWKSGDVNSKLFDTLRREWRANEVALPQTFWRRLFGLPPKRIKRPTKYPRLFDTGG